MINCSKNSGLITIALLLITAFVSLFFLADLMPRPEPTEKVVENPPLIWGAYTGGTDETMWAFEKMIGSKMPISAIFWGWTDPFPATSAGQEGKTLVFYWEPHFGYSKINDGSNDKYIAQFAADMKAYGYPIILAPFDEPNLNENDWGSTINGNTPKGFIAAWQRMYDIFKAQRADNVSFALVYNNISIPAAPFADYYPGDEYVDYIGVDGFNFEAQTFTEVFTDALAEARTFGKPVWIFSTGSIAPKAQFIRDLGALGIPWIWFNEKPFEIDGDSIEAFREIIE
jgi:hypothetical protein